MKKITYTCMLAAGAALAFSTGCSTPPTRIQAGGPTALTTMSVDLADFKAAASKMVQELLVTPQIANFPKNNSGRLPVLNTGSIVNNSDIQMDMGQLAGRINEDLLNGGVVELMAMDAGAVSAAKEDDWTSDKKTASNNRADFFLEGKIMVLRASEGDMREKSYSFQLRLNNRERRTVWQRTYDMAKQGSKGSSVGW